MKKEQKTGLVVLIVIIILSIILGILNAIDVKSLNITPKNEIKKSIKNSKDGYIAKVYITGVIQDSNKTYNQKWLLNTISDLKKDSSNKAIALFINSPGGTVYEADEVYLALQDYKTTGKKVYAYQGPLAASGGYYISCAANSICANRNTLTGSIGVISGSSTDFTELMEKLGIKSTTIHSGKNKNMFNFNEPVTEEQRQIMQSISDECYSQFVNIVSVCRNMEIKHVEELADGRIYTANQALKNGLIDSIDSWDNMISKIKSDDFEGKELNVVEFKYKYTPWFDEVFFEKAGFSKTLYNIEELIEQNQISYPAYLWK